MRLVLLLSCPDRPGIVASVARWALEMGGNIVEADQHTDVAAGLFLQRIELDVELSARDAAASFRPIAEQFAMTWSVHELGLPARLLVLASREGHCVYDLLGRMATNDLQASCVALVANHLDLAVAADQFDVPFRHLTDDALSRAERDRVLIGYVEELQPDLVVLARYMQILGPDYVDRHGPRTINIHHSFLPAFVGARPYQQAYERGVKVIGATAHYVTAELDDGPIIAQGVSPVSHRDTVEDLKRRGRDIETVVLAHALHLHLEHRVIAYANRTVVFD